jgi:hypothetical protein
MLGKIVLPIKTRNINELVKKLTSYSKLDGYYVLQVCSGLSCWYCVFPEQPRVEVERRLVYDELSGLKHMLPFARAICCGREVWSSEWKGGLLTVDKIRCPVKVKGSKVIVEGRAHVCEEQELIVCLKKLGL